MFRRGIIITVGELKEMLDHFAEETEILFKDDSSRESKFYNLTWDGDSQLQIHLMPPAAPKLKAVSGI